jgi:hypothetical protein
MGSVPLDHGIAHHILNELNGDKALESWEAVAERNALPVLWHDVPIL